MSSVGDTLTKSGGPLLNLIPKSILSSVEYKRDILKGYSSKIWLKWLSKSFRFRTASGWVNNDS